MPLMGSIYVGASGLQTSQNTLNTTAHNLSNMDTTGYVRQQALLGTKTYNTLSVNASAVSNQQVGLGVYYSKVRQVRDEFLDITYRKESGRSSFYETSSDALSEVETLLGEFDGATFQGSMEDFWESIQELSKDPSSTVVQGLFVQRASAFIESAQAVYKGLSDYQDNLNLQVENKVNEINTIGKQIQTLNNQILEIEVGGTETANDLRDQRNRLLDELSTLANITYKTDIEGNITVKLEGEPFVTAQDVYEIGIFTDDATGFHTPFWKQNATYTVNSAGDRIYDITNAKVFDMTKTISTELDSDVGGLKATVLARGDRRANYTDLLNKDIYDKDISQSIVMNVQAEFDQLVHGVVTKVNEILADASDYTTGYLCNEDGSPMQLFTKIASDGYVPDITEPSGFHYVDENTADRYATETLYSIPNLQINGELLKQPSKLSFIKEDDSVDYTVAKQLKAAFEEEIYTLNPNVQTKSNLVDYYSNLVSQVANSGSVFRSVSTNQKATVSSTDAAREQIIGVSQDEELTNMIKFQNAYNAASRYINVVDEMLEHLVNSLGA